MDNLGRNIIRKIVVKLEGKEIISIDDYDVLYSYYDCWKTATERRNAIFQGIVEADGQIENAIRHRINATNKTNDAKDQTVASIYDNCFCIPPVFWSRVEYEIIFCYFNITLAGTDANRTLVDNLGRNIIRKIVVKLEGKEIISIDDYDVLYSYYDCWKTATERRNAIFQGIVEADGQIENAIRHRINATNKTNDAKDQTVASIYDNCFCIPPVFWSRVEYEIIFCYFNITLAGTDANRTLVDNLGRNIIRKIVVKLEGKEIISIDDYDVLYSYYDCWKTATERRNAIFQGIVEADGQIENAIRHRINATNKTNDAKDQTVASIYDNCFCIPLDFEILEFSLPLYQYGLGSRLTYELTFADYSDVLKSTDPDATYTISKISLEFDTIINASLAGQIRTEYMKSSILYDRVLRACIIPLNKSDTSFSMDINSPSKSLKCVLLIFTQERSATNFTRDTEEFYNSKITKVEVTV